jgi:uncharacterized protein (TIGR02147 family)
VHGEYRPSVEHVRKQNAFSFLHYYQYIKSNVELGVESLERFPKEERDTSALALTLSLESFQRAKEEIKQLRNRLSMMSEADNKKFWDSIQSDSRRVYQCTFQIFPMSKNDGAQK